MKNDSIQISVPKPCKVNLDEMQTIANGRFCTHCNQTVWDFTNWSEEELAHFFSNRNEAVCGRFLDFQLNKAIPKPQPFNYTGKIAAAALGFSLFFSSEVMAQKRTALAPIKKLPIQKTIPSKKLIGIVKEENGIVMHSVPVSITDSAGQELIKVFTDKDGCFEVYFPDFPYNANATFLLKVVSPRFEVFIKKLEISDFKKQLQIRLRLEPISSYRGSSNSGLRIQGTFFIPEGQIINVDYPKSALTEHEIPRPTLKISPNPIYDEIDINNAGGIEPILKDHPFLNRSR